MHTNRKSEWKVTVLQASVGPYIDFQYENGIGFRSRAFRVDLRSAERAVTELLKVLEEYDDWREERNTSADDTGND